ncbi:hypothetical protein [Chryseobacterium sp. SIMBA_038]|uniref:hypothetical protein n=1 Tax=Chryseobacterium sp. SIMBA_038 TaxID=3085780 RepID=UPI00397D7BC7
MDTISLTDNIKLYSQKKSDNNSIDWSLILNANNNEKTLINKKNQIPTGNQFIKASKDYFLDVPKLIDGFSYKDNIYFFVFIERALWVYHSSLNGGNISRVKIMDMIPGSVDNFGDAKFFIEKCEDDNDTYFSVTHSRVGRQVIKFFELEKNHFTVKELEFSETDTVLSKEDHDIFYDKNLKNDKEEIKKVLRKVLVNNLEEEDKFNYLGNLKGTNGTYFLYSDKNIHFLLFTNNYEWILSKYKERVLK